MPFIVTTRDELMHSAKGSTWKDHKYIKKIGDKYIYATTKGKAANAAGSLGGKPPVTTGWEYEGYTAKSKPTSVTATTNSLASKAVGKATVRDGTIYDQKTSASGKSKKTVKTTFDPETGAATKEVTYATSPAYKAAQAGSKTAAKANAKKKYNAKVKAYDLAKNATSKATGKAKDTGAKKSTKNYNKQSNKKTKTAKTINDIVNAAVAAAKKKKKKK